VGEAEDTAAWSQVRPVSVTGTALTPDPETGDDPGIGTVVPSFTGASFDGTAVSWAPGTPTLFVFLAHWCPHCQNEVPLLVEWFQDGDAPPGLRVLGVATNTDPVRDNYPPSDWLAREGWPWRVVADSENYDLAFAMGIATFPNYVLVDAEGRLVWRASGELPISVLQEQVDAVMAG
jgi:cytochrome c biogenesis protein CcmG/thiol:disulfide interchange protein DsbE